MFNKKTTCCLPQIVKTVASVLVDDKPVGFTIFRVANSFYADFSSTLPYVRLIKINYK